MKKFFWISFLLGIIFLWGCTTTNKLSQDELFQKKQECAKLESKMKEQLESPERYGWRREDTTLYLTEIFYSPSRNSCLYKSEFIYSDIYDLSINDYFTKEVVYSSLCDNKNDFIKCSTEFNKKLQEFKWE